MIAVVFASELRRRKKWVWLGIASDEAWVSLAIVRLGYAASAFAYVTDRRQMLAERSVVVPPFAASVDGPPGSAELAFLGDRLAFVRSGDVLSISGRLGAIGIAATLDFARAPSVAASASFGAGLASRTEKRVLAAVTGHVTVGERAIALDGGRGGSDWSDGTMPRHTRWRWAFGLGQGVAFNLTEGFVGAAECALVTAEGTRALAAPVIAYDEPSGPWTLRGEDVDLVFTPHAVHAQRTNLVVVRSRFLQPAGTFRGRVGAVELEGVPGVVEDHDVLW